MAKDASETVCSERSIVEVTFRIQWPNAPTLEIGSTLTRPRAGLPDVFSMAKAQIIYDDLDRTLKGRQGLALLFDPLTPRTYKLPSTLRVPDRIKRQNINGKEVFPELPYVLKLRLSYDPLNRWLSFSGYLDGAFGVGEPLLLPNVMSQKERDRLKELAPGDQNWASIVEELYLLTINPNRVDVDPKDGHADQALRLGLTQDAFGNVIPEELGALPKALTAALGGVPAAKPSPGSALMLDGQNDYVDAGLIDWHHCACTYDAGSGLQRIYQDGVVQAAVTNLAHPYLGVGRLNVGAGMFGTSANNFFKCQLDEFRIRSGVAKSGSALMITSRKRLLGSEPNLLVYYRFDDFSNYAVNDASPVPPALTAVNGTVNGGASLVSSQAPVGIPPRFLVIAENNDPNSRTIILSAASGVIRSAPSLPIPGAIGWAIRRAARRRGRNSPRVGSNASSEA